jgi:hypothetical protein
MSPNVKLMIEGEYHAENQEMLSRRQADYAWLYFSASEEAAVRSS